MELPGGRNTVAVPVFAPDDFHHGLIAAARFAIYFYPGGRQAAIDREFVPGRRGSGSSG